MSAYIGQPVVLTLDFNRTFGNETVDIDLLNNAGVWETVATTGGTGSITHTLTANQIHAGSAIRFITGSGTWNNNNETVFIDNVQFETGLLIITNGTVNACSGTFYDSGGPGGQYANGENFTYTICPDASGDLVSVEFLSFDVEAPGFFIFDFLTIRDGNSAAAPVIGTFFNTNPPPTTVTASSASGCLTFVFSSDGFVTENGWEATISCISNGADLTISDAVVNENAGTIDFDVTHTGASTSGIFTVEYTTADNTAIAPGDYTATGSPTPTITFSGTTGETQTISIPIIDDNLLENTETFFVNIANPSDGTVTISDAQGEGTINDNDPASVAINDISVNEGAGTVTFTVTLSGADVPGGFTINYATAK